MRKCSLSDKQRTKAIVPIRCGSMRGTAFLVGGGKLLTARHVVEEYFVAHKPIVANFEGKDYVFTAKKVGTSRVFIDVVVLTCTDMLFVATIPAQTLYLKLMSIPYEQSEGMKLSVIGFPSELGNGSCQIETIVSPHSRIEADTLKYDVVTVREGQFGLQNYGGYSGSPVLTNGGYVVGVVSTETYGKLTYCSINRMATRLKKLGVSDLDTPWEVYEDSNLSLQYCSKQIEDAVGRAAGRYHEELHTINAQQEERVSDFIDFDKRKRVEKRLEWIVEKAAEELQDAQEAGIVPNPLPSSIDAIYTGKSFEELPQYIDKLRKVIGPKSKHGMTLKRLSGSAVELLNRLGRMKKQFLCLHGSAGTGKTHISCYFARKLAKQNKNNVYLLFGSQFDSSVDAWDRMLELLHLAEKDIQNLQKRSVAHEHYAIFIIDALNEGAGDFYWKQQLALLTKKFIDYSHLKLLFTIRDPFADEITYNVGPVLLDQYQLGGFTSRSTPVAIDKYFTKYEINPKYRELYKRQFQKPLFLIVFCESYWLLSQDARENINLRILYQTYLTSRNAAVSRFAEEDEKRNVTLKCMRQLAWWSVEHRLAGLIPREDARKVADRICPMRTWKTNLLHALLYENILMETLSDQNEGDLVMFEFENIADIMKAESLLMSELTDAQIMGLLKRTDDELSRQELAKAKFYSMVRALIALWDRPTAVTEITDFTTGRFGYQLVNSQKEYKGERNYGLISDWLKDNKEQYGPRGMLHQLDDPETTIFDTLHPYLRSLPMNKRDEEWTILVNEFLESQGALYYIERMSKKSAYRKRFLTLLTWMLTTSDPDARMFLIRLLYRSLKEETKLVATLMDMFSRCNDHYVLQGLYCAIYGVMLTSNDRQLLVKTAGRVYHNYYEHAKDVPIDIVLRQWTLKILERANSTEPTADYFRRIKLPFKSQHPEERMLKKIPEDYFGIGKGAHLLYYSLAPDSDFHRYVLGSNSTVESREFFIQDSVEGLTRLSVYQIPMMMAPIIKNDYKYNAELSRYDAGRLSAERHHNKTERIGKKYQWLALDNVYAKLTDHYLVKDYRSDHWGVRDADEELTHEAWPWMTRRYDRFDPTLPSNNEIEAFAEGLELLPERDEGTIPEIADITEWLLSEDTHPLIRMQWLDHKGQVWVRLFGYESYDQMLGSEKRETMLYYNSSFVRKIDNKKMYTWAKQQDFTGRWMAERTDCIDFLWNEMPWSDSYKRLGRDQWVEGDQWHPYPCKVLVAYDEQLQEENYGFLGQENSYSYSASMPCGEMMREMQLYTAERGIVRSHQDDSIVAINLGLLRKETGLVVRKDVLCQFIQKKHYHLYTYILGNKQVSLANMRVLDTRGLSGCMMMKDTGDWQEVQKLSVVEKEQ